MFIATKRLSTQTKTDLAALWRIAFPIMIQSLASSAVNLIDALMVGSLGDVSLTAVNINTQFFSRFFLIILLGLGSGGSVLIAQYWGIRDSKSVHRIMGVMFSIGMTFGVVFFFAVTLIPDRIVRLYTHDQEVIRLAEIFLRLQAPVFLFHPITMVYTAGQRATGHSRIPMLTGTSAFILNALLNYVFIFGKFGAPRLGTTGASIGTLISRAVEFALMIFLTYRLKSPCSSALREYFSFNRDLVRRTLRNVLPVLGNELAWGSGVNVYYSFYARISTTAAAAAAAVGPFDAFLFITVCAMGDAAGVLIGNELGKGRVDRALSIARLARWINGVSAIFLGMGIILLRRWLLSAYALTPEAIESAAVLLVICGAAFPIRALDYTMLIGILRPGGDVVVCMLIDALSIWLVGLPLTALLSLGFKFPITIVYLGMVGEWLSTFVFGGLRIRSRKWANVLTGEKPIYDDTTPESGAVL